jgi:phosphoribosylamine-glycine ligase
MNKYRIVTDEYAGFEVQKRFLWIFWLQTEGISSNNVNTFSDLDEAKQWIEELKKRKQKKIEKGKVIYVE